MVTKSSPAKSGLEVKLKRVKKVGIDAMCFIYQFQAHLLFGSLTSIIFSRMEDKKLHGCTSVLSLAEILSYPKLQLDRLSWEEERRKFWQTPNLKVVDIDSKICEAASILKVKYSLTLPDAIQVTTAIFSKAEGFVTNDEKFRRVKELPVILLGDYIK
ncbi:hypothetical protein A2960_05945 [Candidatus Gottesmanbacteria bacterium RIFCSPLOWO2_01_FULL_39_12b]|uniref:PIN domain-containing protein n=1 Tax=Candidatus Gottesmanbacteria bacterium RIFCSPLOWO2_01_FULL_39_12b TaxID=1798388 RepID=A0A1F6AP63_9BACT|nr:MAG: hypothetical protein A2960_05945 [Candidatus Gottesmanbacteria bacterium RIFCSPLOWO2_01_FULL_39_12b]